MWQRKTGAAAYLSFAGDCYPPRTPVINDGLGHRLLCVLFRYPVEYLEVEGKKLIQGCPGIVLGFFFLQHRYGRN